MVYIDIYVPSLDKTYDFEVDEDCTVDDMKREVIGILWKICGASEEPDYDGFTVFSQKEGCPLPPDSRIISCGVESGSRLILL